jgi:bifunctional DNA-binding transcriptional regulator/antitoxin component of YhaV-PrlF toxin-antitoxin module
MSYRLDRPRPHSKTGRVWEIADRLSQAGRIPSRKEVIAAVEREGGNANTASTQYWLWRQNFETRHAAKPTGAQAGSTAPIALQVASDGRLLIPAELRAAMGLGPNQSVTAVVDNGELRVVATAVALRKLQARIRELDKGAGSVVDELIAERRAEGQ